MFRENENFDIDHAVNQELKKKLGGKFESVEGLKIVLSEDVGSNGYVEYIITEGNFAERKHFIVKKGADGYNVMFLNK